MTNLRHMPHNTLVEHAQDLQRKVVSLTEFADRQQQKQIAEKNGRKAIESEAKELLQHLLYVMDPIEDDCECPACRAATAALNFVKTH